MPVAQSPRKSKKTQANQYERELPVRPPSDRLAGARDKENSTPNLKEKEARDGNGPRPGPENQISVSSPGQLQGVEWPIGAGLGFNPLKKLHAGLDPPTRALIDFGKCKDRLPGVREG